MKKYKLSLLGEMKSGEKAAYSSEPFSLKVPDLLCMDIENSCDVYVVLIITS